MHFCAHDVAVACCLAMAEVWVRLPLGALLRFATRSSKPEKVTMRWVLCWYGNAAVNRADAGSIPASAAFTLQPSRFQLPFVSLADRQRRRTSNPIRRVRFPQDTFQQCRSRSTDRGTTREHWQPFSHRGGNCWLLHLTLTQANTGSIPVLGAVAVLHWFQELRCERSPCRFNSDRSHCEHIRWQFPLGRKLDCLSSRCGFDSRCHRFTQAAFDYWLGRLLLRQQEGDRNCYAVLASIEATKRHGRFCWQNRLVFIQESAGSIPAHVAASNRKLRKSPGRMRTLS